MSWLEDSTLRAREALLAALKEQHEALTGLLDDTRREWAHEDPMYRFYHQSFKVYDLQDETCKIVAVLEGLAPEGCRLDEWFVQIIREGTEHEHEISHNNEWLAHTRPILEANFHARFFLEMAVKYGEALENTSGALASGWAALLYLYGLRY